jgi:beta-glucosidase
MAKKQAIQCPVLLQNNHNVLPIRKNVKTLAVIGKLADDPESQIGCWAPDSNGKDSVTALTSLKETLTSSNIIYAQGY